MSRSSARSVTTSAHGSKCLGVQSLHLNGRVVSVSPTGASPGAPSLPPPPAPDESKLQPATVITSAARSSPLPRIPSLYRDARGTVHRSLESELGRPCTGASSPAG